MKRTLIMITVLIALFSMTLWAGGNAEQGAAPEEKPVEEKPAAKEAPAAQEIMPEEGAVLKVWESEGPEGDFIETAGKMFTEKYGVEIIFEPVGHTDAAGRMDQDGPAGTGADVFATPHDKLGVLLVAGHIMENLVSADRINSDFMDAARVAATADGKVWAFPTAIETYGLFYNKDVLAEVPASFEELIDWGKGFTDKADNKYGIFWEVGNAYFNYAFLAGGGGYMFGENGTDPDDLGINSPGAVKGVENYLKLKEISLDVAGDANYGTMMGLFQEGKAATMINGPWALQDLINAGTNFGVSPLPSFDGKPTKSFSGVRLMVVSAYTKYPKAAQLFAKFISSDEVLLKRFELTKQIPPVKTLLNEPAIAGDEYVLPFLQQAQYAEPMPSIPAMNVTWAPIGAAYGDIWNETVGVKEGLDAAAATVREAIDAQ